MFLFLNTVYVYGTFKTHITVIGGRHDTEQSDWSERQSVVIDRLLGCGDVL